MKKAIPHILLALLLAAFCLSAYFTINHCLQLPFRSTNDTLHKKESPLNMDFLIPGGTHIDEKTTIGEVIKIRFEKEATIYESILKSLSNLIPKKYLYLADLALFILWSFLCMTLVRIFTFAGYGRALRASLFLGGCTYYFMPDFSPGKIDDLFFIGIALLVILSRGFMRHRKRKH